MLENITQVDESTSENETATQSKATPKELITLMADDSNSNDRKIIRKSKSLTLKYSEILRNDPGLMAAIFRRWLGKTEQSRCAFQKRYYGYFQVAVD